MKYPRSYLNSIKERIPEEAFILFSNSSIENVSMKDIANKMNIGLTSLYRYFPNKPKLVIEVAKRKWKEFFLDR